MKRLKTLVTVLFFVFAVNLQWALASGNTTVAEKKTAVTILEAPLNRSMITLLRVNEMQIIQLKTLTKQYQKAKETASFGELSIEELNTLYYTELSKILTEQQLSSYINSKALAAK